MRWQLSFALYLTYGCGRVAFDARDAAPSGDVPAIMDAPLGPFGPLLELTTISTSLEDDPTLTADMREIVFESTRAGTGGSDLWYSQRASATAVWQAPVELTVLNSTSDDEHAGISADGLTLWYASNRPIGQGSYDVWVSTRSTRFTTAWSAPMLVPELNTASNNEAPQPSIDELTMMMATGTNSVDENVQIATRASTTSTWTVPVPVMAVDVNVVGVTDSSPMLSGSGLALYFSSTRVGDGFPRIYRATRTSDSAAFAAAVELPELGMASDPWVTPDEQTIVVSVGGRLYEATRQ